MTQSKKKIFNHFWTKETGFVGMLVMLFAMHFVILPLFGSYSYFMLVIAIFWTLFLIAGIISLSKLYKRMVLLSIIPFLFVLFNWILVFKESPLLHLIDVICTVAVLILFIILVLIRIFEKGPINEYRVIGSIVVYMLLANLWAVIYLYIYQNIPGSFAVTLSPFEGDTLKADFLYFSYITITTTGFGEILPLHPFARVLVQLESIVGVLYPVILIGRLVSISYDTNSRKKE